MITVSEGVLLYPPNHSLVYQPVTCPSRHLCYLADSLICPCPSNGTGSSAEGTIEVILNHLLPGPGGVLSTQQVLNTFIEPKNKTSCLTPEVGMANQNCLRHNFDSTRSDTSKQLRYSKKQTNIRSQQSQVSAILLLCPNSARSFLSQICVCNGGSQSQHRLLWGFN